jgi:ABC-type dipeptide/oligopeptide/nickel transport system permease subunit
MAARPQETALSGGTAAGATVAAFAPPAARSLRQLVWGRLRRDRVAMAALAFLVLLAAGALLAPLLVKLLGLAPPNEQSTAALDAFGLPTGPSASHPFGVDNLGRDILSRVLYGARVSLEVALVSTAIALLLGTIVGTLAAYYGGFVDTVLSRGLDMVLAFPLFLLALGMAASCSNASGCLGGVVKPGLGVVVFVISFASWPYVGRLVRGQVLSLRRREFVEAARGLGFSDVRVMVGELLPNLSGPLIVYATLIIPTNILFEAALSFLGVGVQPPQASWGSMIADAISRFDSAWWYMLFPGLALLATVLAFNLLGDALQDALSGR